MSAFEVPPERLAAWLERWAGSTVAACGPRPCPGA